MFLYCNMGKKILGFTNNEKINDGIIRVQHPHEIKFRFVNYKIYVLHKFKIYTFRNLFIFYYYIFYCYQFVCK